MSETFLPLTLPPKWAKLSEKSDLKATLNELTILYNNAKNTESVYPPHKKIFAALTLTSPENVRVVIIGQDPYHGPNQANGLAFSVNSDSSLPPSLKNIFKELSSDLGCAPPRSGDLSKWAQQGVLLLNTTLTVSKGKAASHAKWPWYEVTKSLVASLAENNQHIVFILWGKHAQKFKEFIPTRHTVLESVHPSPLSARKGFFGSAPFSRANLALKAHQQGEIDWCLSSELSLF